MNEVNEIVVDGIVLGRYANVLLDDWFKRTFGDESRKELLLLLLQELIPERTVVSISYGKQEYVNPHPGRKDVRVDVECTDQEGNRFVVEMQRESQDCFYERSVFNSTFAVQEQMRKGQEGYDFPTVYMIGILDFVLHEGEDRVLYRYRLREDSSGEVMTERIQFLFLELPNAVHALEPGATVLEKFCYALHHMKDLKKIPPGFTEKLLEVLFESAEIAKFAPEERIKYLYDMTTERDIRNQIAYARKTGEAKGREEGIEVGIGKGREETTRSIVANLLKMGMPPEFIAEATGLPLDAVDRESFNKNK